MMWKLAYPWIQGFFLFNIFLLPAIRWFGDLGLLPEDAVLVYFLLSAVAAICLTLWLIYYVLPDDNFCRKNLRIIALYSMISTPVMLLFVVLSRDYLYLLVYYLLPIPSLWLLKPVTWDDRKMVGTYFLHHLSTVLIVSNLIDFGIYAFKLDPVELGLIFLPLQGFAGLLLNIIWNRRVGEVLVEEGEDLLYMQA